MDNTLAIDGTIDLRVFGEDTITIRTEHKTSYSARHTYSTCGRKYQLSRYKQYTNKRESTVDTAYGHAVGTGVQTLLQGKSIERSLFAAFLAWDYPDIWEAKSRTKKSLLLALDAIEDFHENELPDIGSDWELYITSSGTKAAELEYLIDSEFGYVDIGFIDLVLKHKKTGALAVIEIKTSGATVMHEAQWGESEQALGYACVIDVLASRQELPSAMQVYYLVYYTTLARWQVMAFEKTLQRRLEFTQDLLRFWKKLELDESFSTMYPRSGNCISFNSPCVFYGTCGGETSDLINQINYVSIKKPPVTITITDIINSIQGKLNDQPLTI